MNLKRTRHNGILHRAFMAALLAAMLLFWPGLVATVQAGTFGKVVSIGGHAGECFISQITPRIAWM